MKHRIASVGYLNARPLTDALDRARYDVRVGHPAQIAAALGAGSVDVALVPVAAVLSDPTLRIVPGWCIGAYGPVTSVLLVAEAPIERWTRVVLDGESRSSAALARLLLAGPLARNVEIVDGEPGSGVASATGTTAALVIGDAARVLPDRLTVRIDLAEAWTRWTGLPFVFAVWAGRAELSPEVRAHLREAGRRGLEAREATYTGDDLVYVTRNLRYTLDDAALMGLRRYAALGHAAGLFPSADVTLYGPVHRKAPRDPAGSVALDRAMNGQRIARDEAIALWQLALPELGMAAGLRRQALHPGADVGYLVAPAEPTDGVAVLDVDGTPEERIDAILALREAQDAGAGFNGLRCRTPGGYVDGWDGGPTAAEWLRTVAIARLILDNVGHIEACGPREGTDLAQAALHMGCDDYGVLVTRESDPAAIADVERHIRDAGFHPFPRDAAYARAGESVTHDDGRRARRPRHAES